MKKNLLALLTVATVVFSCKRDKNFSPTQEEKTSQLTKTAQTTDTIKLKPVQYRNSDGRVMYAIISPYLPFQQLARGEYSRGTEVARSLNGLYTLIYQLDGNLVLYKMSSPNDLFAKDPIWATNTLFSQSGCVAKFQADGNVVLYRPSTSGGEIAYWSGAVSATNPVWILQDDGNLVGYTSYSVSHPQIYGMNPYASTETQGGNVSNYFGRFKK